MHFQDFSRNPEIGIACCIHTEKDVHFRESKKNTKSVKYITLILESIEKELPFDLFGLLYYRDATNKNKKLFVRISRV